MKPNEYKWVSVVAPLNAKGAIYALYHFSELPGAHTIYLSGMRLEIFTGEPKPSINKYSQSKEVNSIESKGTKTSRSAYYRPRSAKASTNLGYSPYASYNSGIKPKEEVYM